jgi:ribosomal protein L40E
MSARHAESPQFSETIICTKCAARGVIVWEDTGAMRSLVSLSGGFYERLSKKEPYGIELVCHRCGARQPE